MVSLFYAFKKEIKHGVKLYDSLFDAYIRSELLIKNSKRHIVHNLYFRRSIKSIRKAAESFTKHSRGDLYAKDVLLGTFLRFERLSGAGSASTGGSTSGALHSGRVGEKALRDAASALKVTNLSETDFSDLMVWFDTDGSGRLDYNELSRQLFGDDVLTRHDI